MNVDESNRHQAMRERAEAAEAEVKRLRAEVATARSLHFEGAARALSKAAIKDAGVLWSIQTIRALAPLDPGLVAVPVETLRFAMLGMEQIVAAVEGGWALNGSPIGRAKWRDALGHVRAALSALLPVKP